MPERLRVWCEVNPYNHKTIIALTEGAVAGSRGISIATRAAELRLVARSAEGDAFEEGWAYGVTLQPREERRWVDPYADLLVEVD